MTVPDGLLGLTVGLALDMPERLLGLVARLLGGELARGLDRAPEEGEREGLDWTRGEEGFDSLC